MRAPVMPNGWPSAIAPPCGFSLSLNGSTPIARLDAELLGLALGHHDHRRGAVVEGAGVACGDGSVVSEGGLESGEDLDGGAWPRAVVLGEHLAIGKGHRDDLAVEKPVLASLDGRVLALDGVTV